MVNMKFHTYEELAQRIAEMTPEQRSHQVMTFDSNTGEFIDLTFFAIASDYVEPAPENQLIIYQEI